METLDKNYWEERHQNNDTPWHIGLVSTPIKEYIDQIKNKKISVLIPGAGHPHEAAYLTEHGFEDITICDISPTAIQNIQTELHEYPQIKYLCTDFFNIEGNYDLILEQTFFCAINPSLREKYVDKMYSLLNLNGTLTGVLFASYFDKSGPPFGGSENEYKSLFSTKLHIHLIKMCYNSVGPRSGNELFFICKKIVI
ncbi:MAG: methyltransferase domain-containing protein [Saprospiraceae bacterium]